MPCVLTRRLWSIEKYRSPGVGGGGWRARVCVCGGGGGVTSYIWHSMDVRAE